MASLKWRLALIGVAGVLVSMLVAAVVFNLFMSARVAYEATRAVEAVLDEMEELDDAGNTRRGRRSDDADDLRSVSYLELDADFAPLTHRRRIVSAEERQLAAWFAEHPTRDAVGRIDLGRWVCYGALVADDDEEDGDRRGETAQGAEPTYLVLYVDVTGEREFAVTVDVAFGVVGLVMAALAGVVGHRSGASIERAREGERRFFENMSHELKTPLAAISGFADAARAGYVSVDEAFSAIERESERMGGVVAEILDLSRLESGAITPKKELIVVEELCQDCLMPFEGTARSRALDVDLDLGPGVVDADPVLFEHALTNVYANAFRHAAHHVSVRYADGCLTVANDGELPDADQLPHLFERFFVGEGGSSGIGLALTAEICACHGWEVTARVEGAFLEVRFDFGASA